MKPRCRWRIDGPDLALVPYRLQVGIIDNRRVDGKVRQEHIADLGTVMGIALPEFWVGIAPKTVIEVRKSGWENYSVLARVRFWEGANPRLAQLANRLDPKAFRMMIHQRIPWPKQAEREKAEAMEQFKLWQGLHEQSLRLIKNMDELIASTEKERIEAREVAHQEATTAARWAERLARF